MTVTPPSKTFLGYKGGCRGCLSSLALVGVFLAVGAGLSIWGWSILQNARASSAWPTVTGRVVSSEVTFHPDDEDGDSYRPEVVYRYVVDDVTYENGTIKFGENSYSSERRAEEIAAGYPVGSDVVVHYDPEDPDQSVLEPGVSGGSYIVLGIGLIFVVAALIAGVFSVFTRGGVTDD